MRQCLTLEGVKEAAAAGEVSTGVIYYWFNEKVLPALSIILANEKPGPKPATEVPKRSKPPTVEAPNPRLLPQDGRPEQCPECGSNNVHRIGNARGQGRGGRGQGARGQRGQGYGGVQDLGKTDSD